MLKLYNSLSRKIEEFKPIDPPIVGMYTCGPTVYQFAHIGNFRSYLTADLLTRVLKFNRYEVNFVMNITDVGHLTNDTSGGADTGEDKILKTALKEGKSATEVAEFYTEAFLKDADALNITQPNILAKATNHIKEQIDLIKVLENKGFTYKTSDGIYFDISKFSDYGKMSSLAQLRESDRVKRDFARIEVNPEKKNPRDFALWKFSNLNRQMEWESPWGIGFPGWHIECSAMSMKYLGDQLDIHTGGVDHKEIHHPNEIAQSEAATGKKFVNYWVHTAFMMVAGQKMSKSLGNIYTVYDLEKEKYDPLALRYLFLMTHYRQEMNFTFGALDAVANALGKLKNEIASLSGKAQNSATDSVVTEFDERFRDAINNDMDMPKALSVVWELVKSKINPQEKKKCLFKMDEILGLNLKKGSALLIEEKQILPANVKDLIKERNTWRKAGKFNLADKMRKEIEKLGFEIEDTKKGTKVRIRE